MSLLTQLRICIIFPADTLLYPRGSKSRPESNYFSEDGLFSPIFYITKMKLLEEGMAHAIEFISRVTKLCPFKTILNWHILCASHLIIKRVSFQSYNKRKLGQHSVIVTDTSQHHNHCEKEKRIPPAPNKNFHLDYVHFPSYVSYVTHGHFLSWLCFSKVD